MADDPKPRRDRNSGRVFWVESKQRWAASVTVEGREVRRLVKTEAEAKVKVRELVRQAEQQTLARTRMTLEEFIIDWLALTVLPARAKRTYETYSSRLERHVLPHLGKKRLADLKPRDFRELYARLQKPVAGEETPRLSPNTVEGIHTMLHGALRQAVRDELIHRNPLDAVVPPRHVDYEATPLSLEQARELIEAMRGHEHEQLWHFILWTGCRFGEASGLRWQYVDEAAFQARVWWAVSRVPLGLRTDPDVWWEFKELKNRQRRAVPLTLPALAALRGQRAEIARLKLATVGDWQDHDLVFPGADGRPLRENTVIRRWWALLAEHGLPDTCRIHDLRHTTAELSLENGAELIDVARLLGHRDATITDRVYAGRLSKSTRRAAQHVADAIGGKAEAEAPEEGYADRYADRA